MNQKQINFVCTSQFHLQRCRHTHAQLSMKQSDKYVLKQTNSEITCSMRIIILTVFFVLNTCSPLQYSPGQHCLRSSAPWHFRWPLLYSFQWPLQECHSGSFVSHIFLVNDNVNTYGSYTIINWISSLLVTS